MSSLFAFNFRLGPWEGCLNLNFDQVELAPGFAAVCTRDQLGLLWRGDPKQNENARATASSLARALIHAHAFVSFPAGIVLEVEPVTWLEVRECSTTKVVSGYMHQTLAAVPLDSNHPDKARLLKAAELTRSVLDHPALSFAIGDFYAARREIGPYSSFYAFRVLEDVGFHFGTTKEGRPDWDKMNAVLGTTKDDWRELTDAGTWARHLSKENTQKIKAIDLGKMLSLAHKALRLVLKAQIHPVVCGGGATRAC